MNNELQIVQQLELPISQPRARVVRRRHPLVRPTRAHWWFAQMRAAVDQSAVAFPPHRSPVAV
jgi:hypothetical protein